MSGQIRDAIHLQSRKVMVVDDHDDFRTSVARLIRSWGHEVAVASDGPSALSLAEAFQPECGIVDVSLPGMNGLDLARHAPAVSSGAAFT
jgi:Response regulator containing CheY-like receiver domain and AraC-type DNA-binding domain